ncbi:hypothetical protein [Bacillus sp. UMB0893]|uniref:hypothetical protein n=1 Tax=Bacillus sp. UMB0893 TaxID=2066053 RepID=UPI0015DFAD23|nr:hypothetical protein [Bacillus sp. UMB0893]
MKRKAAWIISPAFQLIKMEYHSKMPIVERNGRIFDNMQELEDVTKAANNKVIAF